MMTYSGPAPRGGGARAGGGRGGRGRGVPAEGGAAAPQGEPQAPEGQARRGGGAPGQPATVEMYLSDYKVENGVKMPHVITREIAGEIQEQLTFKSFKFNPNFKSNTFTQPK
jgi:hypothetical protein